MSCHAEGTDTITADYVRTMARYNHWMNDALQAAARGVDPGVTDLIALPGFEQAA